MQKFVNNPDFIVDDMLKGYVKAHKDSVCIDDNNDRVIKNIQAPIKGKVGLVSGGGSGHEPAFLGYVGHNMLDAVAVGEVFSSPPAQAFYDAFVAANGGAGVACLFGNYAGDNMNVKMAIQMAEDDDIEVKYVVATDDVASSPKETKEKRHGIAGGLFMWKIAGAKASLGASLDEIINSAQNVVNKTRSVCVGLSSCIIPAVGKPNFTVADGTLEFGIGHHGETGIKVEQIKSADAIATEMTATILDDFAFDTSKELAVLVSGLGATPIMELYVLYNKIADILTAKGHTIYKNFIGNYVTSLDMNGASLTIVELDDEIRQLLDYPAESVAVSI